jgi:amino acid permease
MGLWRGFDKDKQAYITNNAFRYSLVTIGLLGGSLATALLVEDLGLIFGLVGATGATIISFILPGISYYKMPDNLKSEPKWKRTCALLLYILGLMIMPVCTTFLFL